MKTLYIVDYWVPFPSSEYGGVVNVIAENDDDAFDLLSSHEQFDEVYVGSIMPNIKRAQKFKLAGEYESSVIDVFIT